MKKIIIFITILTVSILIIEESTAQGLSKAQMASLQMTVIEKNLTGANGELREALLQDIELFLNQYRGLPVIAKAQFIKGKLLKKQRNEEGALVTWLQTLYENPRTEQAIAAKQQVLFLLEKSGYRYPYSAKVKGIINAKKRGGVDLRLISLIKQLSRISDKGLSKALQSLEIDFLYRYPYHVKADEIQLLFAKDTSLVAKKSGAFAYEKFLALYPNSRYRPDALFGLAEIQNHNLDQFEQARANYKILIRKYPKHKLITKAYMNLATLLEDEMDKTLEAINAFNMIVTRYPRSEEALPALKTIAELEEDKLEQPRKAVVSLRRLARLFKSHKEDALDALDKAAGIAIKDLEDDNLYVEVMTQTYQSFPRSGAAPEAMFDLAEFKAEELHDLAGAKALYRQIIKKYPKSEYAEDARDNLK